MRSLVSKSFPVANGWGSRRDIHGNFMAAAGLGSFAAVGHCGTPLSEVATNLYLSLEVGEACQLRCRHCIYHKEHPASPRPNPDMAGTLRGVLAEGLDPLWISLSGKEPTLFPDALLNIARIAHRPERLTILMTNGLRLEDELLEDLAEVIDCFDISLDGDEAAHDWMRGPGTFRKTWSNVERICSDFSNRIGLIATAVHGELTDGRAQIQGLLSLARLLENRYGSNEQVSLSISLYFGPPEDPLRLTADDLVTLVEGLAEIDFPTRILWTSSYAHLWPEVSRRVALDKAPLAFDGLTALPYVTLGQLVVITFHLTVSKQLCMRVSNDGDIFLSCNHLPLGDKAAVFKLASIDSEKLSDVVHQIEEGRHRLIEVLTMIPNDCATCHDFDLCRGGDGLSGILFNEVPADPYCPRVARS